jgi:hypothetical protein
MYVCVSVGGTVSSLNFALANLTELNACPTPYPEIALDVTAHTYIPAPAASHHRTVQPECSESLCWRR